MCIASKRSHIEGGALTNVLSFVYQMLERSLRLSKTLRTGLLRHHDGIVPDSGSKYPAMVHSVLNENLAAILTMKPREFSSCCRTTAGHVQAQYCVAKPNHGADDAAIARDIFGCGGAYAWFVLLPSSDYVIMLRNAG